MIFAAFIRALNTLAMCFGYGSMLVGFVGFAIIARSVWQEKRRERESRQRSENMKRMNARIREIRREGQ